MSARPARWPLPARVLLLVVIAAGCRSSSSDRAVSPTTTVPPPASSTTEPPTSSTTSPQTAMDGPERCGSAQLRAGLLPREGAAGTSFLPIELRNVSPTPCTLEGYAAIALRDRGGRPVVADPTRDPDLPPPATGKPVRVDPGDTAQFLVAFGNIEPVDGPPCPSVSEITIVPPGETDRLVVGVDELLAPCGNARIGPITPPQPG